MLHYFTFLTPDEILASLTCTSVAERSNDSAKSREHPTW